jgi:1-acyl-sn-glycerol-3-phosphate acyltransferase
MKVKRFVAIVWRTIAMYFGTHLVVFALLPVALLLAIFNRKTALGRLKQFMVGMVFRVIGGKVSLTNRCNLEPGRPYLIISNYPGTYTIFALMQAFPQAAAVAQAFLSRIPVLGRLLAMLGTVFVDPKRILSTRRAIDRALQAKSREILIFPEGKRSLDGRIHRFQRGFIYILRNSRLDLLPVTANGFYTLKPAPRFYVDPSARLELVVHPPIRNSAIRAMTDKELIETVHTVIEADYRP